MIRDNDVHIRGKSKTTLCGKVINSKIQICIPPDGICTCEKCINSYMEWIRTQNGKLVIQKLSHDSITGSMNYLDDNIERKMGYRIKATPESMRKSFKERK